MTGSRGLTRSVLSNWGAFVFSAVVNLFLSPYVVRSLGNTAYGAWVLLGSMVGYLGLLDLGVRISVTRYIARFRASGAHESSRRVYSSALLIFSLAGALAILLSGALALMLGKGVLQIPPNLVSIGQVVAVLGGLNVAVSLVSGVFGGVLIGLERFDYSNAIEIGVGAVRAVAVVLALHFGYGLIMLALVQLAATLIRGGANYYLGNRLYPELGRPTWRWDPEYLRLVFAFGISASFIHVTGALMVYSDSLVVGALLPVGMITYFAIAGNLYDYSRSVPGGIALTISPRLSALDARGDRPVLGDTLLSAGRLSTLVTLPIAVTYMVRGSSFVGLWMGPTYADLSGRVLWVLALTLWTTGGYQVVSAAMIGLNKHKGLIPILIVEALANLVLSVILVRMYGVVGTAIGTAVPRTIVSAIVGPLYVRRTVGIALHRFWLSVFLQPALAIIPFAAVTLGTERVFPARNILTFFLQVAAALPFAALGAWYICFSPSERTAWATILRIPLRQGTRR
ncbi:MAG TPA: polysaccharide biosynthesis C-terminal domain-containing protein [Gemmatimonadaceae bacterium]|nr:polysaccharide biosynthesis C-terminal domain-containing protein [Gemmatimonadaceae bacterium]